MTLEEKYQIALEALRQINLEWCPHPDVTIERLQRIGRDWCGVCHNWVRLGETNLADQALARIDSKGESGK